MIEDHIRRNRRATVLVCLLMLSLLFGIIFSVGLALGVPPIFSCAIGLPISLIYIAMTYSFSLQSVLKAAKARPVNSRERKEKLFKYKVEEMAIAAGLPVPKAYVQESSDINAFATGRRPEEAIVCVTTGALEKLDGEELEGVISHEMSHIANRDILLATVTVGVVGAIALISEILLRSLFWGGTRQRGKNAGLVVAVAIVFAILAPLFSRLVYLAMSRRREYLADASGALLTRNPTGLARALEKIQADLPDDPKGSKTVAPLYIANPFKRARRQSIWSTHPPLKERIRRLQSM
jgi:heat shock protein HtpX